jgi:hypothetical protein
MTNAVGGVSAEPGEAGERPGSFDQFEERFGVIESADEVLIWDPDELPGDVDPNLVWTVVEAAQDTEYILAGYHRVNRIGYILAQRLRVGSPDDFRTYVYHCWNQT